MTGSACSMPPSVSSENTTPKPNVSSGALRSQTVISCAGSSCLVSAAKYSPPGPPPMTAIRTATSRPAHPAARPTRPPGPPGRLAHPAARPTRPPGLPGRPAATGLTEPKVRIVTRIVNAAQDRVELDAAGEPAADIAAMAADHRHLTWALDGDTPVAGFLGKRWGAGYGDQHGDSCAQGYGTPWWRNRRAQPLGGRRRSRFGRQVPHRNGRDPV